MKEPKWLTELLETMEEPKRTDEAKWITELLERLESADYEKEIYVISAPRCGNTITRYILEFLTGYASYGYVGSGGKSAIDSRGGISRISGHDESGIIFKRHLWSDAGRFTTDKLSHDTRVIAIIRNPLDWYLRYPDGLGFPKHWFNVCADIVDGAISNNFEKTKIVFYESLMTDPAAYVKELAEFIDSPVEKLEKFIVDIDQHMTGRKAPEQHHPNQLEPNLCELSEEERIREWNKLMLKFPESVREFFSLHYPQGKWS